MKQVSNGARLAALSAVALITAPSEAQNYIRNPSFEEYNWDCWTPMYDIRAAYAWTYPGCGNQPAYYNVCNNTNGNSLGGVPSNFWGYEEPSEGAAYLGFFTYVPGWPYINGHTREYAIARFWQPLDAGQEYCIRMKVSLMDSASYRTSALHCLLWYDSTSICGNNDAQWAAAAAVTLNTSQVESNGWSSLEGSFIAGGGETTLTIGDFTFGAGLDTTFIAWRQYPYFSAYYVDEVYLGVCDNAILENAGHNRMLNVYPNPIRTGEDLRMKLPRVPHDRAQYQVFDLQGRIIASGLLGPGDIRVSTDRLHSGTYLLQMTINDNPYQASFTVE
jgi:hypothetical protein